MQKETRSLIWGVILVIIGFVFLGSNLDWFYFDWGDLWPSVMILGGLFFWVGWLSNRKEFGLLMPGSILLVYGVMFQYSALSGWYHMDELWPGFLLGPGIGFVFMYLLGNREKGLLVPAFILIGLAGIFWIGEDGCSNRAASQDPRSIRLPRSWGRATRASSRSCRPESGRRHPPGGGVLRLRAPPDRRLR